MLRAALAVDDPVIVEDTLIAMKGYMNQIDED